METKRDWVLLGFCVLFSFAGMATTFWVKKPEFRMLWYVLFILLAMFFLILLLKTTVTRIAREEFTGKAICELPDGAKFEKIDQYPKPDKLLGVSIHHFHLLLKRRDVSGPGGHTKLYYLPKHLLLDKDGKELSEIPKDFEVKKGTKGKLERLKEFHEVGITHEVYYLIS